MVGILRRTFYPGSDRATTSVISVLLFVTPAELLDRCLEKGSGGKLRMAGPCVQQKGLTKFLPLGVRGFGDAIGVEHRRVAGSKLHFSNSALPGVKPSEESSKDKGQAATHWDRRFEGTTLPTPPPGITADKRRGT